MKERWKIPAYKQEIEMVEKEALSELDWELLEGKTFLITGASGLIGLYLTDVIMKHNARCSKDPIKVIALARNECMAKECFKDYWNNSDFCFIQCDVNQEITIQKNCDYIIHAASNTHPMQYSTDPIGTITTNVIGTRNILEYAVKYNTKRILFISSVEIYGENRGDIDQFTEDYCGNIDCNTLRAGYSEAKRLGEALCQAYIESEHLDIIIPRLSRTYGATMKWDDSKAIAQFIKKAVKREDIILKSQGHQLYSYCYVADAVRALLYLLIHGIKGHAYNVSGMDSDITLKRIATILAEKANTNLIYELPDDVESRGYSKASKATLNTNKILSLGWKSKFTIQDGLEKTVNILRQIYDT